MSNTTAALRNLIKRVYVGCGLVGNPEKARVGVVFSHGLGDTHDGFKELIEENIAPIVGEDFLFVLPTAPNRRITCNGGMMMPGWYDIVSFEQDRATQPAKGLQESVDTLAEVAAAVGDCVKDHKVILAGFSQGGGVSSATALTRDVPHLAGVAMLSSYVPHLPSATLDGSEPELRKLNVPVFIHHGTADQVVPADYSSRSVSTFQKQGCTNVDLKLWPGLPHSVHPGELDEFAQWLIRVGK